MEDTRPLDQGERRTLLHLCYGYHVANDGVTFILPTAMGLLFIQFNMNWIETGTVFAVNLLVTIFIQLVMGYYSDVGNQRRVMLAGMLSLGASTLLMVFSTDFLSLLLFATFLGVGLGTQHASSYSISSRIMNEKVNRQAAFGDLGKGLAILSSTLLIFFLDRDISWRLSFLAWGLFALVLSAATMVKTRGFALHACGFTRGKPIDAGESKNTSSLSRKDLVALSGYFVLFALYSGQFQVISNNLTTYMTTFKDFDARVAPFFFIGFFTFAVLGSFLSLPVSKRAGRKNVVVINYALYSAILILYSTLDPRDAVGNAISFAAMACTSYMVYPIILESMSARTPKGRLGLVFGIIMGIGWLGGFVSSLLGGLLSEALSPQWVFYLAIIQSVISLAVAAAVKFG